MKKRSYGQNCSLAHALDVIGERWSLLLIRELLTGPKRFKDLLGGLKGIGTNLLASRLKDMESSGIIEKTTLPPPAGSIVYQLTESGKKIEPIILDLVRWGMELGDRGKEENLSKPDWDIVAMRALFQPEKALGINENYQFHVDGVAYFASIEDGKADIELGEIRRPDLTLTTDRKTLSNLGRGLSFENAVQSGKLHLEGDLEAANRLGECFIAPQP